MVVPDATLDERFAESPMVTGPHHIRFYAGITLRDADGFALGTLAVADVVPRQITEQQKDLLKRLAASPLTEWNSRKSNPNFARPSPTWKWRGNRLFQTAPNYGRLLIACRKP